jgi:uncharacterized protein (TIGR00661 family)
MKILYGVQATGNGHITRARALAHEFTKTDVNIDYLFTGRPAEKLFDMSPFGDFRCLPGLTFFSDNGQINYTKTILRNRPVRAITDICSLSVEDYDLVITDFEPITAWAARLRGVPSLGISHQYSFQYNIPKAKNTWLSDTIIRYFAPAKEYLGVHWHHFSQPILPPIAMPIIQANMENDNKILVYLPFLPIPKISKTLALFRKHQFYIYCDCSSPRDLDNLHLRPFSRTNFQQDLATCSSVICNTGFTLISEALQYGKRILSLPLKGQGEQLANAEALKELNLATIINSFEAKTLKAWLNTSDNNNTMSGVNYPHVAEHIVKWIIGGMQESKEELATRIWNSTPIYSQ